MYYLLHNLFSDGKLRLESNLMQLLICKLNDNPPTSVVRSWLISVNCFSRNVVDCVVKASAKTEKL